MAVYIEPTHSSTGHDSSTTLAQSWRRRYSESDAPIPQGRKLLFFTLGQERRSWPQPPYLIETIGDGSTLRSISRFPSNVGRAQLTSPKTSRYPFSAGIDANSASSPVQKFVELQGKISNLREKGLRARSRLELERERLRDRRRLQYQSMAEFVSTLGEAITRNTLASSHRHLSELHQQCVQDLTHMETQEDVVRTVNNELNTLEFRLLGNERTLVTNLTTLNLHMGVHAAEIEATKEAAKESATRFDDVSGGLPPLLQQLYDRSGDLGIQHERLEELVADHQQTLETRDFLADRGELPDTSDEEIQKEFEEQHRRILAELMSAEREVEVLKQACEVAGIDTESRRLFSPDVEQQDEPSQSPLASALDPPDADVTPFNSVLRRASSSILLSATESRQSAFLSEVEVSHPRNAHATVNSWLEAAEDKTSPEKLHAHSERPMRDIADVFDGHVTHDTAQRRPPPFCQDG